MAVIDSSGAVIGAQDNAVASDTADDKSRQLRERVLRLVEARVGAGNAVVEVSVDTVTKTESIRERRFDPNGRVAISTDVEERSDSARNQSADVTVASNLPDGDGAGGDESNSNATQTRERVNYEVSETEREVHNAPGAVKRLTVAVLVNGTRAVDAAGVERFEPMPQAELAALEELVASAVGFDAERGDVITLKSLNLPVVEPQGTLASASIWQKVHLDAMSLIQMVVLAFVALVLGLFVIRPILTKPSEATALLPASQLTESDAALTGEIATGDNGNFAPLEAQAPAGNVPALAPSTGADPVERLRAMIGDKQEETVEILRSWLEEEEERV